MAPDRGSLARLAPLVLGAAVVALAAGAVAGPLPFADGPPDGEAVVDRVADRYDGAETVVGNATVTVASDSAEHTATISFAFAEPDEARLAVRRDGDRYVAGTNGSLAWVADPANGTARVRELPDSEPSGLADYVEVNASGYVDDNTDARALRTATLDGRETYVVSVEPANESHDGNATLWVDAEDYRVHRVRAVVGEKSTTVEFSSVRFNVSVHESTFRPPDDAAANAVSRERYDGFDAAQVATAFDLPRLDAEDYAFAEAVVVERAGRTVVLQRYEGAGGMRVTLAASSDDLGTLRGGAVETASNATSVSVTVDGANATYVELDDRAAVVWERGGVTRAVVADRDRAALVALAERVRS